MTDKSLWQQFKERPFEVALALLGMLVWGWATKSNERKKWDEQDKKP